MNKVKQFLPLEQLQDNRNNLNIKYMKRIILLLALSAVSFTGIAEDSENYIYNGSARCQVMNSDKGTLTVNELAIKYGYKIINSGSGYATLLKDGRYYTVSKVMVNRAGLVTFVRVERLK